MIRDKVARSFPRLRIILAHLGQPWIEDLRRRETDPRMAAAPGFVARPLLRSLDAKNELLLIVHWALREHALAYRRGAVHDDLRRQELALLEEPLRTRDYELLGGDC